MTEPDQLAERKLLNAALSDAQGEFEPIRRDKTVDTGGYKFSYAELGTILTAVRPVLAKHGLALVQLLEDNGRPGIRTELRHSGGGVIGANFPLPYLPESPQQLGSLLTYLRRYAIVALLGIAAEDDDDAQQAAVPAKKERQPATERQIKNVWRLINKLDKAGVETADRLREGMGRVYGTENPNELYRDQASDLIERLEKRAVANIDDEGNLEVEQRIAIDAGRIDDEDEAAAVPWPGEPPQ